MFTNEELELLVEALDRASRRHVAEARFYPNRAVRHLEKAGAMDRLIRKIDKLLTKAA